MKSLSTPVKISLVGASLGIALIAALATYFRRRKRSRPYREVKPQQLSQHQQKELKQEARQHVRNRRSPNLRIKSPNGEIPGSRVFYETRSNSTASINTMATVGSNATITLADTCNFTPDQLCELGMEALHAAITHWEEALERIDEMEQPIVEAGVEQLRHQLNHLLERAYKIQDHYEEQVFQAVNANVAVDSAVDALQEMDRQFEQERKRRNTGSFETDSSDQDSFVSATDLADLSDLETHQESFQHLALYEAALLELKHGSIPFRTLRTKMVNCMSDTEFLAKLHCIRLALQTIFEEESQREWFVTSGKQMLSDLLIKADRDPEDFQVQYDELIAYAKNKDHWPSMEDELRHRGVKMLTFYDVVIDFILFDAFDDLESPPSSVTTVVQNRWLSNGFKETALCTAVWSVLKAKRRLLRVPRGFIAHFYCISEHISPVLCWGFLGPPSDLKDLCEFFREQVLQFMRGVFSFDRVHYTTVEQLSADVLQLAKHHIALASERMAS